MAQKRKIAWIAFLGVFASAWIQDYGYARKGPEWTYLGSLNRAQQSYYLDNQKFAKTIAQLENPIPTETSNYKYQITIVEKEMAISTAIPKTEKGRSYISAVFVVGSTSEKTAAILCESNQPTQQPLAKPTLEAGRPKCPSGSSIPKNSTIDCTGGRWLETVLFWGGIVLFLSISVLFVALLWERKAIAHSEKTDV